MNELSVRFNVTEHDGHSQLTVALFRPDCGAMTAPAPFTPPLGDTELADLRWYLEVYSTWPTGPDYERADRIEARLEEWGRALFRSISGDHDAARLWQQFLDHNGGGNKLLTIDAEAPQVLRLPWELLADEGGHFFACDISVRRRLQKSTSGQSPSFALPLRVLALTSRPDDAGFIDHRCIATPLLDALEQVGAGAQVEFLSPPTLKALTERLRDNTLPPVHVLHFDGHGVYDKSLGLGYLLFENDKHGTDRVDANRLGTLLNRCGVPLMVLNACQSAKQEDANPYASVAARLIRAGVGSVLAMNHSVLVVAARKFTAAFYGGLVEGRSVGQAVDRARYALLSDEERHTITRREGNGEYVEKTITLRDWFLPALYQQAHDPVVFDAASPLPQQNAGPAVPRALHDPRVPGGLPEAPQHGFHGRAREMLKLERALAEQDIVVLHGFGGIGKTSLAAEAGRWFHRTGRFPGGAAFVSFEHGGSLQQLCSWVGQAVSGDPDFMLGEGEPVQRVGQLLQTRPALLILDNFESVLGRDPLMPPGELQAVLDAVWSWAALPPKPLTPGPSPQGRGENRSSRKGQGVGPKILITTRDTSFHDSRFGPSRRCRQIELGGLARQDALELAAAVLEDYGIERSAIPRQPLVDLMERLGGHPLSLSLVLPHLRRHSPQELSQRFEELLPGFCAGAATERNESLEVSLEFSLRRLGDATRAALPALAVFEGGAFEDNLLAITRIDPELWKTARRELEQAALLSAESLPGLNYPFLQFHPTLLPWLATQLDGEQRRELQERYRERYYQVSRFLYESDTQHPHQARAIALRELPNLKRAFALAVAAAQEESLPSPSGRGAGGEGPEAGVGHAAFQAVNFADNIAQFLDYFGRWRERDALLAQVAELQLSGADGISKAEYLRLSQQGDMLLQQGRAAQARTLFEELLQRLEAGAAYDAAYDRAMTFWRLGRCLNAQGQAEAAIQRHQQALAEFERLSQSSESAKKMWGRVYADLGDNLAATGRFDEAQQAYESSLKIVTDVEDHRAVGVTLGQLGTLAMQRGDLQEAASRYHDALQTFRALGESRSEAVIWHQLGMVAQEAQEWEEAERCYRESLKLHESLKDLPGVAASCNQLALVAKDAGRLEEAERWYLRAIEVDEQLGNPKELAPDYNNLADLYLAQGRLEEAERYARRSVAIVETLDLSAEPWKGYGILAGILSARGRSGEAVQWRRKEQESFAAYPGASLSIQKWEQVIAIIIAACQENTEAQKLAEQIIEQYQESNDWGNLVAAFRQILNGERDLEELRDGLDHTDFAIIHRLLAILKGEAPQFTSESSSPQAEPPEEEAEDEEEGMSLAKFLGMVGLACRSEAPAGMAEQLHGATRQMAQAPDAPAELRAFGQILNQLLSGDRQPDLSPLSKPMAAMVRELLAQIQA